jgi:uncharacterized membrane protein
VAALAYLLLPVSGLIAYFNARTPRMRWHGLQAVVFGTLWPVALYACSRVSIGAAQAAWAVGGVLWLWLLAGSAIGRDPRLPLIGRALQRAARQSPQS